MIVEVQLRNETQTMNVFLTFFFQFENLSPTEFYWDNGHATSVSRYRLPLPRLSENSFHKILQSKLYV